MVFFLIILNLVGALPTAIADEGFEANQIILPPTLLLVDSGINPYHIDFRLPKGFDPLEHENYYPKEAILLNLSLDAETYNQAVEQDREIWDSIESGQLYAFNGTRIVGAVQIGPCSTTCIRDTTGHGTIVASSAAGSKSGTCPECRIVVQKGSNLQGEFNKWVYESSWIDAISISFGNVFGVGYQTGNFSQQSQKWTDSGRSWFVANGNGGFAGGATSHFADRQGPPWIFRVGHYPLQHHFTRSFDIVAPARVDVATHDSMDEYRLGGGTSGASPAAAGHAMMLLWEARRIFNDPHGWRDGALTHASDESLIPKAGPLSDGRLTGKELENLLRESAREIPSGPALFPPDTPAGPHSYWLRGFGLMDNISMDLAYTILHGDTEPPDKSWEWWWYEMDQYVRERHGGWTQWCLDSSQWTLFTVVNHSLACMMNNMPDPTERPPTPPD